MKVYMIARGYPSKDNAMNGIFELDQAIALSKRGVEVVLLALDLRSIRRWRSYKSKYFVKDGVKVYSFHFPLGRYISKKSYELAYRVLKRDYEKVERIEGRPDLIHTHFTDQGYIASKLAQNKDIPFVLTEGNSRINQKEMSPLLREVAEETYQRTDKLIAVSPDFRDTIKEKFGVEAQFISLLPDLDIFKNNPNFKRSDKFRIVSTGHVIKSKGVRELIEAFYKAFKDDPNVSLTVYGDGNLREPLLEKIKDLGMDKQIFLPGHTQRKDIQEGFNHSDLFVLYSYSETFGLAYLEALEAGLPVIASRCGGPEHLINKDNGILVDRFDVDALVEGLKYMKEHIEDYDREKISEQVLEKYSEDNISKQIMDVYNQAIDKHKKR
ncbi:MAG: glycosyltransferase [Finegoldia sp.]|nr:glycosyltransferase [Finegoldia sp.]